MWQKLLQKSSLLFHDIPRLYFSLNFFLNNLMKPKIKAYYSKKRLYKVKKKP